MTDEQRRQRKVEAIAIHMIERGFPEVAGTDHYEDWPDEWDEEPATITAEELAQRMWHLGAED